MTDRLDPPRPTAPQAVSTPARVAGAVSAVEALALLVVAAVYLLELATGSSADRGVATMSLATSLVGLGLLLVLATAWWRGRRWPRTATVVWNLLLLPASWTLAQANGLVIGAPLAAVALVGVVSALLSPSADLPEDAER